MQGAFSASYQRFQSKKSLKEAVANNIKVILEATSIMGNEYGGPVSDAPDGKYYVVGPDPYKSRKWYASILKKGTEIKVS